MLAPTGTRLAVWGDPIAHSLSPRLHTAAYRTLGLDWSYRRERVDERGFTDALGALSNEWRGLSLTMPLKAVARQAAVWVNPAAQLTGAVNTLVLTAEGPHGFNTDVGGIVRSLADDGISSVDTARIVGAGATATSALVALAEIGVRTVHVAARRPERAAAIEALGERVGVSVRPQPLDATTLATVDVTLGTLPGGASLAAGVADRLADAGGALTDVVYGHWPTALSAAWESRAKTASSGLGMLLHQAILQVRAFCTGEVATPLPDEARVLGAMRSALMSESALMRE